jgi:glycosyltransferase involved in cell wall biosynthesis
VNRISYEDEIVFKEVRPASRWQRSNSPGRSDGILAAFRTGPRVSVVIPTLNEAENLPDLLPWIPDWVSEVVLVDGNSTDGTVEMALSLLPDIKIVMQKGQGKGSALRQGFAAATGDIIVMLDADGSTSPSEIPAFVGALLGGADFAKGSRFLQGGGTSDMPFYRRLGNFAFVMLIRLLFGGAYSDLLYGYNAFWAHVLPQIQVDVDGFEIETLMNIRALRTGVKITEVPSFEAARQHGIPKLRAIPDGWRVLKTILRQYYQHRVRREQMNQQGLEAENKVFVRTVGELFREALHLWRSREHLEAGYYIKALDSIRLTYQGLLAANFSHPEDTALQQYYRSHFGDASPWAFAEETSMPTTSSVLQIPVTAWEHDLAQLDDQSTT